MSSPNTRHICEALASPKVAGTLASRSVRIMHLRGIQFTGIFFRPEGDCLEQARQIYLQRFPLAVHATGETWGLEFTFLKMTDNSLGFGTKLIWERGKGAGEANNLNVL